MDQRAWHSFYERGVPANPDFEDIPIPRFLERSAAEHGDAPAIIFMNRSLSYRRLKQEVDRFAMALAALGVQKDSRVAIQLYNVPQTVIAYYATLMLGAQAVMTNFMYVEREIEHQWNEVGCSVAVVTDALFEQRIRRIRHKLPVKHYVVTSIAEYMPFPVNLLASRRFKRAKPPMTAAVESDDGIHFMRRMIWGNATSLEMTDIAMDDTAVLQFTGGTTGVPKAAMLTHRNLSSNVQQLGLWLRTTEHGQDVFLSSLPLYHVFGMTVGMNLPISVAAAIVLVLDPRNIRRLCKTIAKHRVTVLPAVPAQFNAINTYPGIEKVDLTSITTCVSGSAPLPREVRDQFEKMTGAKIAEGFGLSETSPVTHCNPLHGKRKPGSIGVPLPRTDAKLVGLDDGPAELPPGRQGELVIRGPQVMKGYWKRPDATRETLRDGWLRTGDVATMDEDGYFFIVGRKKDVIIAGGYNVYPDEVDEVLLSHPAVLEAGTIGIPDPRRGETVKSFVVLSEGKSATAEELIQHCRGQLAAYKVPRQIEFRESLPKSAALKILRRELRPDDAKVETTR